MTCRLKERMHRFDQAPRETLQIAPPVVVLERPPPSDKLVSTLDEMRSALIAWSGRISAGTGGICDIGPRTDTGFDVAVGWRDSELRKTFDARSLRVAPCDHARAFIRAVLAARGVEL